MNASIKVSVALFLILGYSIAGYTKELLTTVDRVDGLKMDLLPNYDGRYLYFSHFDSTGNAKELVVYDLERKHAVARVRNLRTGTIRFHSASDKYVVLSDAADQKVVVYDYVNRQDALRVNVKGWVTGAWVDGSIVFIVTAGNRFRPTHGVGTGYTINLESGKIDVEKEIVSSVHALNWQNIIIVVKRDVHLYDLQFNEIAKINIPFKYRFNSSCDRGPAVLHQDHILVPANCGEIYDIDLPAKTISHVFDYMTDCMFPSISISGDLMAVASRSGDNANCELKFIRYSDKTFLATLPKRPSVAFLDGDKLILGYYTTWSSASPIEIDQISQNVLSRASFYGDTLMAAHERALAVFHRTKDAYEALAELERANVQKILTDKSLIDPKLRITVLNDYGYFLTGTYDRYKEAQSVLETVTTESSDRYVAYLNLADLYWKSYLLEGDLSFLPKARSAYEQYLSLLRRAAPTRRAAKRQYMPQASRFDRSRDLRNLHTSWEMGPATVVFAGEEIYSPSFPPGVTVLSRNSLNVIGTLLVRPYDDEFQDNITGIGVCRDRIYVTTTYRYEDSSRPSLHVYDRHTLESVKERSGFGLGLSDVFCVDNRLFIRVGDGDFEEWDQTTLAPTSTKLENRLRIWQSLSGSDAVPIIRYLLEGTRRSIKGRFKRNSGSWLLTMNQPPYPPSSFNVYDLTSDLRVEDIPISEGRRLSGFVSFPENRQFVTVEFARAHRSIVVYDIRTSERRTLIQGTEIGPITRYRNYLVFADRRDLIFYDMNREEFSEILKDITGPGHKGLGTVDYQRITSLNIDRDRLFIWTHLARYARVLELRPLLSDKRVSR